jgi:glycosyltransferase involved in cell wall biosynthesis
MKNPDNKKTIICMVVFSSYPLDVRVRREAEALTAAGMKIDVLCRTSRGELSKENVRGITTFRIKLDRKRSGKIGYLWEYFYFFMWALWKVSVLNVTKKYDIIHVHNMPDFLVFTSLIPKIFGAKVILDLHDPMPELFTSIFKTSQQSIVYKILLKIEKLSIWYSDAVLTPNIAFKNIFISRSCPPEKVNIIMNSPDENVFKYFDNTIRNGSIASNYVLMYHGAIIEQHGLDIGLKAVALLKNRIPNIKMIIFGDGNFLPYARKIINEHNISDFIEIKGSVINDEIAKFIPQIDLGIIPNRSNLFTQLNFPVRIFEYITYKKAVIVPRTRGIRDYFDESSIYYFEPGNIQDLAETIYRIYQSKNEVQEVINKSYDVYQRYTWKTQKENLVKLVEELVNK